MKWIALLLAAVSFEAATLTNESEIASFLEELASVDTLTEAATDRLNELSAVILEGDNLPLVHLLRRAVRNHDRFSSQAANPFIFYYKHYQQPSFLIPDIELTLDVRKDRVVVTTELSVVRQDGSERLVLDGQDHKVLSVSVNGEPWVYKTTGDEVILEHAPGEETFTVTICSEIDPFHNRSFMGLYTSGTCLTSQCESEGARRIFFTQDRPDVLSRIRTTILADRTQYPVRISNGNLVEESLLSDGRLSITWDDPIPKPSYLFACVLGDLSRLKDRFVTRSGRSVVLEVYVEPGKEARASYSLVALKKAMEFDELFFDREYDLDCLKMVAVPDFNFGAMENKGLLIFNDACLLADSRTGTDASFRRIAHVVAHEYFHNWSGNRVTVRNWFEIALKEAFTDFRAALFSEWLFGSEFIRPKDVAALRECQFPEETSGKGHPLLIESYVTPMSIYDHTTYIKGREVFRTLQAYMDRMVPDGFRKAQNLYFSKYDGQAVTFRELLSAANEVLSEHTGENLSQFERWFDQAGTPQVRAEVEAGMLTVTQSCPHPETGEAQKPFVIPFSYEFLRKDGTVACSRTNVILTESVHRFAIPEEEGLVPLFMHGYSAPVRFHYEYRPEELACLLVHGQDPFCQWEAGQNYSLHAILNEEEGDFSPYLQALQNPSVSVLGKAALLQVPSVRALFQKCGDADFRWLQTKRGAFLKKLARECKPVLEQLLQEFPEPPVYAPTPEQMQVRELRHACLHLLAGIEPSYASRAAKQALSADNFDSSSAAFAILAGSDAPEKEGVVRELQQRWKDDKLLFNTWLKAQAASGSCTVADIQKLMEAEGFDPLNPNHIRSLYCVFLSNLGQYHDPKGEGYAFIVDRILEIAPKNPTLAHSNLATLAFLDYEFLPEGQKNLMRREMERLLASPLTPPETRDLIQNLQ